MSTQLKPQEQTEVGDIMRKNELHGGKETTPKPATILDKHADEPLDKMTVWGYLWKRHEERKKQDVAMDIRDATLDEADKERERIKKFSKSADKVIDHATVDDGCDLHCIIVEQKIRTIYRLGLNEELKEELDDLENQRKILLLMLGGKG